MKDLVRQKLGINVEAMDLLNAQIAKEAFSSAVYLAMASWCDQRGYNGSAKLLYDQSAEERDHQMKIFHFINDNGGTAYSPEIKGIPHEYNSLEEIYESALEQEIGITKSIHAIVAKCRKVQDLATENFLQWFVNEQMEEEKKMRNILELFDIMGNDGIALKFIDERVQGA